MIYVVLAIAGLVVIYAVGLPVGGLAVGIAKLASAHSGKEYRGKSRGE